MPRRRLLVHALVAALIVVGVGAWRYQGEIIGVGARWSLERISALEESTGGIANRRGIVGTIHRRLLMPAPPDGMVPELFNYVTLLSARVATGEITLNWAAYLYSGYARDLMRERPDGTPRRSDDELRALLDREVAFFAIRKRPHAEGFGVADLIGQGDDTITLDEIEAAEREGRDLDLR